MSDVEAASDSVATKYAAK